MRTLMMTWLAVCGLTVWAVAGQDDLARYAAQLDESRDRILERVVVPSAEQPQGEVQLVRRGELLVVRTLLASTVLKRVAAAIDAKEQRNWPESREGHRASKQYREELFRATELAWDAYRARSDRGEARQMLAIEFIVGPRDQALVALSLPRLAGTSGALEVREKQPLKVWRAPAGYVRGNMLEIVMDSFDLDRSGAEKMIRESAE